MIIFETVILRLSTSARGQSEWTSGEGQAPYINAIFRFFTSACGYSAFMDNG